MRESYKNSERSDSLKNPTSTRLSAIYRVRSITIDLTLLQVFLPRHGLIHARKPRKDFVHHIIINSLCQNLLVVSVPSSVLRNLMYPRSRTGNSLAVFVRVLWSRSFLHRFLAYCQATFALTQAFWNRLVISYSNHSCTSFTSSLSQHPHTQNLIRPKRSDRPRRHDRHIKRLPDREALGDR